MKKKKIVLVCGAGGFIGSHLVKKLKKEGFYVVGVDLKKPEYSETLADEFILGDLTNQKFVKKVFNKKFDEVYQLAADMGGAGYIFTGDNDAKIMYSSALINLNVLNEMVNSKSKKIFYSSSACIYPDYNQLNPENPKTSEDSAYPAQPDSEYGWEKLFSEHMFLAYYRNFGLKARKAHGGEDGKRHRRQFAEKWQRQKTEEQLKYGETESKQDLFYILMNV